MGETVAVSDAGSKFIERLQTYRDRLLQVDWRNRSILLKKTHKRWSFDLGTLLTTNPAVVEDCIAKAIRGKGTACLIRDSDLTDEAVALRSGLVQLERSTRLIFEESGLQDTYLGFPFLEGHVDPEHFVRAPAVLFPIRLEHQRRERVPGWYVVFSEDSNATLNRALFAALRKVRGINLPDDFPDRLEEILEQSIADKTNGSTPFLQRLFEAFRKVSFPIQDPQVEGANIRALRPLASEEVQNLPPTPLRLAAYAVVGNFPQGSTAIYQDYEKLIQLAAQGEHDQGVIDDLLEAPSAKVRSPEPEHGGNIDSVPDRELNFALPSDGSQDAVVLEAQHSECVVVRGPPGTGKSQVIVNLITNALAKGENVMVVCQKRAALDVVYQRLGRARLADSVILLHDARADRSGVYSRLARRLQEGMPSEDPRIDQELQRTSSEIDQTIAEINEIVRPLDREFFNGVRLRELYAAAQPGYRPRLKLEIRPDAWTYQDMNRLLEKMTGLEAGFKRFDAASAPLSGRRTFAALEAGSREEVVEALTQVALRAVPGCLILPSRDFQQSLIPALQSYRELKDEPSRHFRPRWWKSRRLVERLAKQRSLDLSREDLEELQGAVRTGYDLAITIDRLAEWFSEPAVAGLLQLAEDPAALRIRMNEMLREIASFDAMQEYDRLVASLRPVDKAVFHAASANLATQPEPWAPVVKQEILAMWIAAIEAAHPQLKGDPFGRYTGLRDRFDKLMDRRRALFAGRLGDKLRKQACVPILPPGVHHHRRSAATDWNKLLYEFNKRRRVKPVRKVMEEFAFQFLHIAPCWLVSPEAASDIFPLERGLFDLLIFDEASQLAVERALPAMYRAKRVVIAGDEKQLRPFDLFQIREEAEEVADDVIETESLLVLSMRVFPPRYLSWHYRSKHQELIDFSNHAFYDGLLQIAPNTEKAFDDPPIEFVRCHGTWEDRTNPVEAGLVVDTIGRILGSNDESRTAPSVGVITFNDAQRNLILDVIETRRDSDPEFDRLFSRAAAEERPLDDRPFVKNIENVQGDERDVIVFSVGYAPDRDGRLRVQFGSLNLEGGENRLNVAVTRARQRIVMVVSFDPEDLPVEGTKNPGPKRLRDYLLYAKLVSGLRRTEIAQLLASLNPAMRTAERTTPLVFESPLEQQVYQALRGLGYQIDTQVGFSGYRLDLAIVHPKNLKRYVLGIECDGAMFHSARSARERDVARQKFLESRGWKIERIWSRNWWRNQNGELNRIRNRVEALAGTAA